MEKLNFSYSLKNIPNPVEKSYKLRILEKIEIFTKKMHWRAIFFKNNNKKPLKITNKVLVMVRRVVEVLHR